MGERNLASRILSVVVENGGLSIGRTLLMSVFVLAMVQWCRGIEIPSSQVTILMVLFGYVLGSKVVGNVSDTVGKVMETKKALAEAIEKK
jgi:hypothetical protein